jgi:ribose transport system permease protein
MNKQALAAPRQVPGGARPLLAFLSEGGMLWVLLGLCLLFTVLTWSEQHPSGTAAADALAADILRQCGKAPRVLVAVREQPDDAVFATRVATKLAAAGATVVEVVKGEPRDARGALARAAAGGGLDCVAVNSASAEWLVFADLARDYPALATTKLLQPKSYFWPNFLKRENLLNIANQISVIAILAIGMTMVIITGGIDLSVGSLIALASVTAAVLVRDLAGGVEAGMAGMLLGGLGGIAVAAAAGAFSGLMIVCFGIPPFIATLAMMLVAGGTASLLARGESVYQLPDSFMWLGRGADLLGLPNAVVLMLLLYFVAHVVMTRMTLGRHLLALGGNREAARLSGVSVSAVVLLAYVLSGALAGLGGVVMASQLKSGSPNYGQMYELYTIAAVVVGGTSLTGGEGSMLGTLVGALIIAVIQNGMNLIGIESYTQRVVLGAVILAAVLLDRLRHRNWGG